MGVLVGSGVTAIVAVGTTTVGLITSGWTKNGANVVRQIDQKLSRIKQTIESAVRGRRNIDGYTFI